MICHLNQQNFSRFGTILPERQNSTDLSGKPGTHQTLQLSRDNTPVFQCAEPCWVYSAQNMTVLCVSEDGKEFTSYYLDKPVCIHPGMIFYLFPVRDSSSAELSAAQPLAVLTHRSISEEVRIPPSFQIDGLYTLFYHEKEQGFFFPGEAHPMLELTYIDQGTLHSVADGVDLLLEQGDMVLYGPEQWHMQYADIGVAPRYLTISFDLSGQIPTVLLNRRIKASQACLNLIHQILREQEQNAPHSPDMILALLTQLLIAAQRSLDAEPEKLRPAYADRSENAVIRRAQQYISAHVRQKLSVTMVAQNADVSSSYLTALFHKHLQIAPGEYIRRIKLQESKQMIRENSMNFTQIAAALQYSTVHHFSRQFKDKFGISHTEYAKSVR